MNAQILPFEKNSLLRHNRRKKEVNKTRLLLVIHSSGSIAGDSYDFCHRRHPFLSNWTVVFATNSTTTSMTRVNSSALIDDLKTTTALSLSLFKIDDQQAELIQRTSRLQSDCFMTIKSRDERSVSDIVRFNSSDTTAKWPPSCKFISICLDVKNDEELISIWGVSQRSLMPSVGTVGWELTVT